MNIRICFKPVVLGGGKDSTRSTFEFYDIDDRMLKDFASYLREGKPVGGTYGEDENDEWLHIDFREVAFMVPIQENKAPSISMPFTPPGVGVKFT